MSIALFAAIWFAVRGDSGEPMGMGTRGMSMSDEIGERCLAEPDDFPRSNHPQLCGANPAKLSTILQFLRECDGVEGVGDI